MRSNHWIHSWILDMSSMATRLMMSFMSKSTLMSRLCRTLPMVLAHSTAALWRYPMTLSDLWRTFSKFSRSALILDL